MLETTNDPRECVYCRKVFRPWHVKAFVDRAGQMHHLRNGSMHMNHIDPRGHFCTMRCAARYGVRVFEAQDGLSRED